MFRLPEGASFATDSREEAQPPRKPWQTALQVFLGLAVVGALFPFSRISYLSFHALVEIASVAVAITIFSIGWNARRFARNDALLLLAIAYLPIAIIDVLHTLSFKGMGVFPGGDANMPTQFWLAARFLEAAAFSAAALLAGRRQSLNPFALLGIFLATGLVLILSIHPLKIFPDSFLQEAGGLTPFKIASEYLIATILAGSGFLLWRRQLLSPAILRFLLLAIAAKVLAELSFTLYIDVYGIANFTGHLLKLASVVFLYQALVAGVLLHPYDLLFRDLVRSEEQLRRELAAGIEAATEKEQLLSTVEEQRHFCEVRAREAEEGNQILEAVLDYIPEGIIIADAQGRIRRVSRHALLMAGRTLEELQAYPVGEHAAHWGLLLPDGTPAGPGATPLTRAIHTGTVVSSEEWMLQRPDGSLITLLTAAGPIRDRQGRVT
ncbi:MAG: PAS domain-containing protein, partial [Desulfuromonadales bacterium]|nr:PAS domain-containing protein [Desulfuromonadales bacterium]